MKSNDLLKMAVNARKFLVDKEYADVHLSYQLAMMSRVVPNEEGVSLFINAPTYDVAAFRKKGYVIHDNKGSYASANDTEGGFSGKHKDYIRRMIEYTIDQYLVEHNIDKSEVEIKWS